MHASKRLDSVNESSNGSIKLHFTDGTTHECDILFSADGIRSTVRRLILGENDLATYPTNSSAWCVMVLRPYTEAQASIGRGPIKIDDAREYI